MPKFPSRFTGAEPENEAGLAAGRQPWGIDAGRECVVYLSYHMLSQ